MKLITAIEHGPNTCPTCGQEVRPAAADTTVANVPAMHFYTLLAGNYHPDDQWPTDESDQNVQADYEDDIEY